MYNKLLLLSFLTVGIFVLTTSSSPVVSINSTEELEIQLHSFNSKTLHLVLESSIEYQLSETYFFHYANKTFTMTSSNGDIVNISCRNNDSIPSTTGLAFINSVVNMSHIRFIRCGIYLRMLPENITSIFNDTSQLFYRSTYGATLLFIYCQVYLEAVEIQSSNGFAILGFNLIHLSRFRLVQVGNSTMFANSVNQADGSGMMLHFSESQYKKMVTTNISLINVIFENNIDFFKGRGCLATFYRQIPIKKRYQLFNAAGLTIIYAQRTYKAYVNINGGKFIHNAASYTGGIYVFYFETRAISKAVIRSSEFKNNEKFSYDHCHGVTLHFFMIGDVLPSVINDALVVEDSNFTGVMFVEKQRRKYGSIYVGVFSPNLEISFSFKNLYFSGNSNRGTGGTCLTVALSGGHGRGSNVNVIFDSLRAIDNSNQFKYTTPTSLFHFIDIQNVTFRGTGIFKHNFGTVIFAEESNVYLDGNMYFSNNTGEKGSCIRIERNGVLYLMERLTASFIENRAYFGGAIYVNSASYTKCAIQVMGLYTHGYSDSGNITFTSNFAKLAGNSIFAVPIYSCSIINTFHYAWIDKYSQYFELPNDTQKVNNSLLQLSTSPREFILYFKENSGEYVFLNTTISSKYPGETVFMKISVYDGNFRHVSSVINMEVSKARDYSSAPVWLKRSGGSRALEGKKETQFNISIHTSLSSSLHDVALVFSIGNRDDKAHKVTLKPCPMGFELDTSSGSCECSRIFNQLHPKGGTQCFIDSRIISIPSRKNIWIGTLDNDAHAALSTTCPLTYCNSDPYYQYIVTTDKEMSLTNDTDITKADTVKLCLNNRMGTLCGQCNDSDDYVLAFGSNECIKCTNNSYYLTLAIVIHLVGGLILIFLIYVLQLTLTTGTLNGIIFYAQAVNAGLMEQISVSYHDTNRFIVIIRKICHSFLTILNLNFGFSVCSIKGMTQLWMTGTSLIFPVYLLTIVFVLIIASYYSTWFSNRTSHSSIQVLVTVVHLSFSKLLLALIDVFTPATIHTSKESFLVWYWDGSIRYMSLSHLPLAIVTVITVSVLLIPYITLLLFGNTLTNRFRRASFYLRPILEAIHAPYKENRRGWFVARLLLVVIIYMVYVVFRSQNSGILNVILSCVLSLFLIGQALFQPFKNKFINVLDCWLMLNITLVYVTLWSNVSSVSEVVNIIAVLLAALTFLAILLYHLSFAISFLGRAFTKIKSSKLFSFFGRKPPSDATQQLLQNTDSFYAGAENYREPLCSSKN